MLRRRDPYNIVYRASRRVFLHIGLSLANQSFKQGVTDVDSKLLVAVYTGYSTIGGSRLANNQSINLTTLPLD